MNATKIANGLILDFVLAGAGGSDKFLLADVNGNVTSLTSIPTSRVSGAGNVTEVSSSILTITGGTAAVLNSGLTIQVKQASGSQAGYLSAADWTTFNGKLTNSLLSGRIFIGNGSNIATAVAVSGDVTINNSGITAIGTGVIVNSDVNSSAGIQFSKMEALTGNLAMVTSGGGFATTTITTTTEIGYVSGVSGPLQPQLDSKLTVVLTSPTTGDVITFDGSDWINSPSSGTGIPSGGSTAQYLIKNSNTNYDVGWHTLVTSDVTDLTASAAELNLLTGVTTTSTQFNYLNTVTSNVQTQLDAKVNNSLAYNAIWVGAITGQAAQLGAGTNGYVLTIVGGSPVWNVNTPSTPLTTKGDIYVFSTVNDRLPVGTNGQVLSSDSTAATGLKWITASGSGTVTSVSVVTNQGVSGSVATATTTPAITLSLGALTGVTSLNGLIVTANTGVITTGTWNGNVVGVAFGGTNISSYTIGDLLYATGSTTLAKLADVAVNSFLISGGVAAAPAWSTTKWTNAATTGDILYASASNTYSNRTIGTTGQLLTVSGGLPTWATIPTLPYWPLAGSASMTAPVIIDTGNHDLLFSNISDFKFQNVTASTFIELDGSGSQINLTAPVFNLITPTINLSGATQFLTTDVVIGPSNSGYTFGFQASDGFGLYGFDNVGINAEVNLALLNAGTGAGMILDLTDNTFNDGGTSQEGLKYQSAPANVNVLTMVWKGYVLGAKTYTGKQTFSTSTTTAAAINIPAGVAPTTSLANGDIWATSTHLFARLSGTTYQLDQQSTGGITNSAANTEMMKSDGTNAIGSGLYSTTNGNLTFGSASIAGDRTLLASNSTTNAYLILKGENGVQWGIGTNLASSEGSNITLAGAATGVAGAGLLLVGIGGGAGTAITVQSSDGASATGDILLKTGNVTSGSFNSGNIFFSIGTSSSGGVGNISFFNSTTSDFGGGQGIIHYHNAVVNPTTNPTNGGLFFVKSSDNLPYWRTPAGVEYGMTGGGGGTVTSVSGTSNRITSTGGTTPIIDIAATYVGQSSITTLGTIGTGTWQGSVVGPTYGGTGVNNGSFTITLGGNLTTSGAFNTTFTVTGSNTITFPNASITVARIDAAQTFTGVQTFSSVPIFSSGIGSATATTQTAGDNSTKVATTAYVTTAISGSSGWQVTGTTTLTGAATIVGTTTNIIKYQFDNLLNSTPTIGAGLWLYNSTAATVGQNQESPSITLSSFAWKTNATAASQQVDWLLNATTTTGSANPSGTFNIQSQVNGGGFTPLLTITSGSGNVTMLANSTLKVGVLQNTSTNTRLVFRAVWTTTTNTSIFQFDSFGGTLAPTSGTLDQFRIGDASSGFFAVATGSAAYNDFHQIQTINQTGSASGAVTMINITPTLTSVLGAMNGIIYNPTVTSVSGIHNAFKATAGDIAITDSSRGLILKDTAGTPHYWRVTISTLGVLTTTDLGTTSP